MWAVELSALAALCNLPLRCTDAEVVEQDGRRLLLCHGYDQAPDAPLVEEDAPEKAIVAVGAISIQLAEDGRVLRGNILKWAEKSAEIPEQQPGNGRPDAPGGEAAPQVSEVAQG